MSPDHLRDGVRRGRRRRRRDAAVVERDDAVARGDERGRRRRPATRAPADRSRRSARPACPSASPNSSYAIVTSASATSGTSTSCRHRVILAHGAVACAGARRSPHGPGHRVAVRRVHRVPRSGGRDPGDPCRRRRELVYAVELAVIAIIATALVIAAVVTAVRGHSRTRQVTDPLECPLLREQVPEESWWL